MRARRRRSPSRVELDDRAGEADAEHDADASVMFEVRDGGAVLTDPVGGTAPLDERPASDEVDVGHRSRRRWPWLAAVAVGGLVVLVVAIVVATRHPHVAAPTSRADPSPVGGPPPTDEQVGGSSAGSSLVTIRQIEVTAVFVDARRPRQLTVVLPSYHSVAASAAHVFARGTSNTVTLTAQERIPQVVHDQGAFDVGGPIAVVVTLPRSLGRRQVRDNSIPGSTDIPSLPVPVLDPARLLARPATLPASYHLNSSIPLTTTSPKLFGSVAYAGTHVYVTVTAGTTSAIGRLPSDGGARPVDVRGSPGRFGRLGNSRCVSWSPDFGITQQVCAEPLNGVGTVSPTFVLGLARSMPTARG